MSGTILAVVPKRKIDFGSLPSPGPANGDAILADRVSILPWREVTMLVDVHDVSLANGNTIQILAMNQSWTAEDPSVQFVSTSCAYGVSLSYTTPNPAYLVYQLPALGQDMFGHMLRIIARGNRGAAGGFTATLSVRLSVKDS